MTSKSNFIKSIEKREGDAIEEILRRKYVDEDKTIRQIAADLGITYMSAHRWLKASGIYSKRLRL